MIESVMMRSPTRNDHHVLAVGIDHRCAPSTTAVVALVTTEPAAGHTAWERFTPEGPLALLPLSAIMLATGMSPSPALLFMPVAIVIARTDARAPHGLDDAIDRAHRFAAAGADVLFVEALTGEDEIELVSRELAGIPLLFNWAEGGKTPPLPLERLKELGFAMVIMPIGLLLAVSHSGQLLALRVTQHKETPGLGDYIDPKKDRNKARPWISQFSLIGFDSVPPEQWHVKKDGGHFDQMAGATISARAVTNASGRALAWVNAHRVPLFALPANSFYQE